MDKGNAREYLAGNKMEDKMMKENNVMEKLMFACDYQEGAHPAIMKNMEETNRIPHFFTMIKQHGALLAKGWLLGIQFDELFRGGLYQNIGKDAVRYAAQIQKALLQAGFQLYLDSPTNQVFVTADDAQLKALNQFAAYSFWEKVDESHTAIRIATSWSTTQEETDELCRHIAEI